MPASATAELQLQVYAVNPAPDGEGLSHLPAEHVQLPDMYNGIAQVSTALLCVWVRSIIYARKLKFP
eukprot:SAG11_NODE_17168_length_526_cov_0.967213_1_plen_66_part_10